ncbi:MAG: AAA family ATPase [Deltaproteobacteria bacterium]|nr:AAA family ATPase [Deltaproteobacteria bacterium]
MSEKLDPEEVKEITSRVFGEIAQVVAKYEGFIEKFIGDAVMAIFGATKAYEDNPIRAIKTGIEIHQLVESLSPEHEERIGKPLSMHTGINTGLVVTGEVNLEQGTHGIAGDTINLAARLSSLGKSGDILVGPDTYIQAEGYFDFERLAPRAVKGKEQPIPVYRVISQKAQPRKVHRLQGVRARLIGRKVEMAQLKEAVENLRNGKGSTFAICGTAGTGKSRLVEEFKETLDLKEIQWREGQAYPYAQNIPYFPLINLMNKAFHIEEGDPSTVVRKKVEKGVAYLLGEENEAIPYVGSLFSLRNSEIDDVSPEFWKSKLQGAIQSILSALANRGPTVVCLEDLHWADPSFMELIRLILTDFRNPILFLCIYRPVITLLTSHQISSMVNPYHEIRLRDLSPSESQDMIEGLLNTENVPPELHRFVREKVEGNPFYLEEVANSLIESKSLVCSSGGWKVTRPITELDISSTIHGVIAARLDRLEKETKRILQEASVIGRTFFYEILNRVTDLKKNIDSCLSGLERLDFIKARSLEPDLEYFFKHALTQEVVYNGLLKKERKKIHERIGLAMEQIFQNRLPEFYETLAFHFKLGQSVSKAVDYLMKSGEKSIARYSVTESHQYYKEAFTLLERKTNKTKAEKELLIELLIDWAYVFYYRGDFKEMAEVLRTNKTVVESLEDKAKIGMFYSWYGWSLGCQNKLADSKPWLGKALQIGEEIKDQRVIGYACTWLTWGFLTMGKLEQAIKHGERAQEISKIFKSDAYLFFKSLAGLGFAYALCGEKKKAIEIANALVEYGKKHSNIRSLTLGYAGIGNCYSIDGDLAAAIEAYERATQVGAEPFYTEYLRMNLALLYMMNNQITEAENALNRVVAFSRDLGAGAVGVPAQVFLGAILIAKGQMSLGLKRLKEGKQELLMSGNMLYYLQCEYILGKVFSQIAVGAEPISLSKIFNNIGFLVKNVPFASKKAEGHFKKVIEVAGEIGAKTILGGAYLDLGLLYKAKDKIEQAKKCILQADQIFEDCEAKIYLKATKKALSSI